MFIHVTDYEKGNKVSIRTDQILLVVDPELKDADQSGCYIALVNLVCPPVRFKEDRMDVVRMCEQVLRRDSE